jgi:hypothetical protein
MMMAMDRSAPLSSSHSLHTTSHPSHAPHGEGVGYTTSAKQKLDELFVTWLSFSDTSSFISSVIASFKLSPASPSSPLDSPTLHDGTPSSFASSPRKFSPRKCILYDYPLHICIKLNLPPSLPTSPSPSHLHYSRFSSFSSSSPISPFSTLPIRYFT